VTALPKVPVHRHAVVRSLRGLAPALLAFAVAAPSAHGDGGWWSDLDKGQGVRLEDVIEAPERHRGHALTFTCVFHQQEREFNPLRTRFNAERYANISVWPDGAALWKPKEFERDFPFLYVARTHPHRDALLKVETFTRLEVTARIEAVVDGYPFLELTGVKVTGYVLGRKVVDAMMRGEVYGRSPLAEQQALAAEQFERALALHADLAPIYVQRVRERLAECYRALGRGADAERVLAGGDVVPGALPPAVPAAAPATEFPAAQVPEPPAATTEPATFPDEAEPTRVPQRPRSADPRHPPPLPEPEPVDPSQPFLPSLPGVPVEPRAGPTPLPPGAAVAPRARSAAPAPRAPVVVDPVLPAPPPGGAPPPRQPRLAGVK
jgi:hypothetical protein